MKIIEVDFKKLKPYKNNPKEHPEEQILKIMQSIKEYGFLIPLVIKKDYEIVCGHGRYIAGERLKLKKIPCIMANRLSDAQIHAFRIAENRLNQSGWNYDLLGKEIEYLKGLNFNLSLTGLESDEYNHLLRNIDKLIENNPFDEYTNMPEYICNNITAFRTILVHFEKQEDVDAFGKLLKQNITDNTKFIYYPKQKDVSNKDKRVVEKKQVENNLEIEFVEKTNIGSSLYMIKSKNKPVHIPSMKYCKSISLNENDIVVDIGSYIGQYAIYCARFPVKKVIAYEPTPFTFEVLKMNSKGLDNLEIKQMAVVGNDTENIELFISDGIGVTNSILSKKGIDKKIIVPALSYKKVIENATIIKIDIEGGEYNLDIENYFPESLKGIIIDFHKVKNYEWKDNALKIIKSINDNGFKQILKPNWDCGWTMSGSWKK